MSQIVFFLYTIYTTFLTTQLTVITILQQHILNSHVCCLPTVDISHPSKSTFHMYSFWMCFLHSMFVLLLYYLLVLKVLLTFFFFLLFASCLLKLSFFIILPKPNLTELLATELGWTICVILIIRTFQFLVLYHATYICLSLLVAFTYLMILVLFLFIFFYMIQDVLKIIFISSP